MLAESALWRGKKRADSGARRAAQAPQGQAPEEAAPLEQGLPAKGQRDSEMCCRRLA